MDGVNGAPRVTIKHPCRPGETMTVGNEWVVPHNGYLAWKYKAHITGRYIGADFKLLELRRRSAGPGALAAPAGRADHQLQLYVAVGRGARPDLDYGLFLIAQGLHVEEKTLADAGLPPYPNNLGPL
jgi:hypothetical protein